MRLLHFSTMVTAQKQARPWGKRKSSAALAIPLLVFQAPRVLGQSPALGPGTILAQATAAEASSQGANVITLDQAIALAEENDPAYATGLTARGSANLDRSISRAALLPTVDYHNQYLYTQPNGLKNQAGQGAGEQLAPKFIANNAIREYASQALVNETVSLAGLADLRRNGALARKASADLEIARRDLVVRVVSGYFGLIAAEGRRNAAQRGADEATAFRDLTMKLEKGREVAHADVVKADLEVEQRQREFSDAVLAEEKARLDLGVLLFPDPRTSYQLAASEPSALPAEDAVEAAAGKQNPDLASTLEAVRAAHAEVQAARAAYYPSLSLNYTYGIDAPQVAVDGPDRVRNLGYSASASLDIPVWDWLATHDRVKQSELRRREAQVALTSVQRQLIAQLQEFYQEAKVAAGQVASLDQSFATAQESLRLTKLRYGAGEATALEVVDAQNALLQAEIARADGGVRYRVALANLQTLTGTL